MVRRFRPFWHTLTIGSVILLLSGCASQSTNHQQAVDAGNRRWHSYRSSLMMQMAQQQFDTGDLEQAEKTVVEALDIDSRNPGLYVLGGRIELERGHLERAYRLLDRAVEYDPTTAEGYYYQGVILQRWQKYEAALIKYQNAYENRTDSPSYLMAIAEMLVSLDRSKEALELLTTKAAYFDQNAGIRMSIAQIHLVHRQYDLAAKYFLQATLLKPDDWALVEELASAQLSAGQIDKAILNLERLLRQSELAQRTDLQGLLGSAYQRAGKLAQAKVVFVKLSRQEPGDSRTWLKLGEVCLAMDDLAGAQLAAQRVTALSPQWPESHLLIGLIEQKQNRHETALASFTKAAELSPDNATPWIMRGMTLEKLGRQIEAANAYARALKCKPDDDRAKRLLANVQINP